MRFSDLQRCKLFHSFLFLTIHYYSFVIQSKFTLDEDYDYDLIITMITAVLDCLLLLQTMYDVDSL